ncbi:ABC transporter ATP-binding protein [Frankia sp. CNm7]|nr:ABC transporter ATP-binding protein [Frankia nepalensis]MBL7515032.1 ABC transporter ATP-binding protein [Frankia nepalensis]MBL7518719.1 ABC transporter ATP-binding protein [Frankia nepalensis]
MRASVKPGGAGAAPAEAPGLLRVEDLRTVIPSRRGPIFAVDGVSLKVDGGQTLGVVGESGSGKSMLIRSITGLLPAGGIQRSGSVRYEGHELLDLDRARLGAFWGVELGMIAQDPMTSLNPVRRVGAQITEPLRQHLGRSRRQARDEALGLLRMVGIPDPERRLVEYPHQLSGGMRQRVLIAAALAARPRMLFADEPTTALDVTVQAQILNLLRRIQREMRMAMVLVTHDLGVVATCTDQVAVMYAGQIVETAPTAVLFDRMYMPYTRALFASTPRLADPPHTRLAVIPGRPPDLAVPSGGCRFAPRCAYARDKCQAETPPLAKADEHGHLYRCWFPLTGRAPADPGQREPAAVHAAADRIGATKEDG